jgi:glucose/arabinose dehydrogenase
LQVSVLHSALASPWGLAFLPDGRLLVTQKGGSMLLLSADGSRTLATVSGLPAVVAAGQGGLLDVALDPDFGSDPWVYWAYSEPANAAGGGTPGTSGTAVARGRLVGAALQDVAVIFRQTPKRSGGGHFGARLVFRPDKTLFVTLGDRQADNPAAPGLQYAQNLATTLGKVVRIARDGSIPADNPVFSAVDGVAAAPGLWSIGHRNPQGAALQPDTGELWLVEHGPQGGDELNRALPGRNYGWPLRSYGCPYGAPVGEACQVAGGRHAPEFEEPVSTWLPTSIAPSGLVFCKSAQFPQWDGNVLLGALAGTALWRVALGGSGDAVREVGRERLLGDLGQRLRCVKQGPDGWFYLLTDSGRLLRLSRT